MIIYYVRSQDNAKFVGPCRDVVLFVVAIDAIVTECLLLLPTAASCEHLCSSFNGKFVSSNGEFQSIWPDVIIIS